MRTDGFTIIAPGFRETNHSEAELLGSAVWLWMHSPTHRDAPLYALNTDLLPAIKRKQFVLATINNTPVFYTSWASLSEAAERRYIHHASSHIAEDDLNSWDRLWFLDWIAPFGHSQIMSRLLAKTFFMNKCVRSLYHRGNDRGIRVMNFHGIAVLPAEAKHWFATHPVDLPTRK